MKLDEPMFMVTAKTYASVGYATMLTAEREYWQRLAECLAAHLPDDTVRDIQRSVQQVTQETGPPVSAKG